MPSDNATGVGSNYGAGGPSKVAYPTSAAPPAGTYYAPPTGSVQAGEDTAAANQAYQQALARFNQQRTGLLTQYGYKGTIDPTTGLMTNLGVDTGSTTGGLQQLLGQQESEDMNAEYGMEDRGVVGGLANQAQTSLRAGHAAQSSGLANQLLGSLSDLNDQQLTAQQTENAQLWQAQQEATQGAVAGNDYNPADLTALIASLTGTGGAGSTSPGNKPAPNSKLNLAAPTAVLKPKTKAQQVAAKVVNNAYLTSKTKKG